MNVACPSETLVNYQTTRRHIPGDSNTHCHHSSNNRHCNFNFVLLPICVVLLSLAVQLLQIRTLLGSAPWLRRVIPRLVTAELRLKS